MNQKLKVAILRTLKDADHPIGSARIADEIAGYGIDLSSRSIRAYLEELETQGLVTGAVRGRSGGRSITPEGEAEINDALVLDRVSLTATKVDDLAWRVTFDPKTMKGEVAVNVSLIHASLVRSAIVEMLPVLQAGFGMGNYVSLLEPGTRINEFTIPAGQAAIGTVCSVTANGVLLSRGVPVTSRFGGVLELLDGEPIRFTDVIYYDGTSLDPLEIFIKGQLTKVADLPATGCGRIGASFREIPTSALDTALASFAEMEEMGLGRILLRGKPNRPLLGFPVAAGRTGLIVAGGLNPVAALEEAGIHAKNFALSQLVDFSRLQHYEDLAQRFGIDL